MVQRETAVRVAAVAVATFIMPRFIPFPGVAGRLRFLLPGAI
jgi:hypothetical protein